MTTGRLIELYGRRYTHFARLAGFVAILIFGIIIAFQAPVPDPSDKPAIQVEHAG